MPLWLLLALLKLRAPAPRALRVMAGTMLGVYARTRVIPEPPNFNPAQNPSFLAPPFQVREKLRQLQRDWDALGLGRIIDENPMQSQFVEESPTSWQMYFRLYFTRNDSIALGPQGNGAVSFTAFVASPGTRPHNLPQVKAS